MAYVLANREFGGVNRKLTPNSTRGTTRKFSVHPLARLDPGSDVFEDADI